MMSEDRISKQERRKEIIAGLKALPGTELKREIRIKGKVTQCWWCGGDGGGGGRGVRRGRGWGGGGGRRIRDGDGSSGDDDDEEEQQWWWSNVLLCSCRPHQRGSQAWWADPESGTGPLHTEEPACYGAWLSVRHLSRGCPGMVPKFLTCVANCLCIIFLCHQPSQNKVEPPPQNPWLSMAPLTFSCIQHLIAYSSQLITYCSKVWLYCPCFSVCPFACLYLFFQLLSLVCPQLIFSALPPI